MKMNWNLKDLHESEIQSEVQRDDQIISVTLSGVTYRFEKVGLSDGQLMLERVADNGERKRYRTLLSAQMMSYETHDITLSGQSQSRRKKSAAHAGGLISPMPGKVFKVLVQAGDLVEAGTVLMILEAMKMEHSIKAPHAGVVSDIFFKEGELVDGGVELATLKASEQGET